MERAPVVVEPRGALLSSTLGWKLTRASLPLGPLPTGQSLSKSELRSRPSLCRLLSLRCELRYLSSHLSWSQLRPGCVTYKIVFYRTCSHFFAKWTLAECAGGCEVMGWLVT